MLRARREGCGGGRKVHPGQGIESRGVGRCGPPKTQAPGTRVGRRLGPGGGGGRGEGGCRDPTLEGPRIRTPTAGRVCGGQAIGLEKKGERDEESGSQAAGVREPRAERACGEQGIPGPRNPPPRARDRVRRAEDPAQRTRRPRLPGAPGAPARAPPLKAEAARTRRRLVPALGSWTA